MVNSATGHDRPLKADSHHQRTEEGGGRGSIVSRLGLAKLHGDCFGLRVVLEGGLVVFPALAGHLETAERGGRINHVIAVDPDGSGFYFLGEEVGFVDVLGPDRGGKTIGGAIGALGDLVDAVEREDADDGPEDFVASYRHVVADVVENRGLHEEAVFAVAASAGDEFGTLACAEIDVVKDLIELLII